MSDHVCRWALNVEGHTTERRSKDDGIKVLGCIISCSGGMDLELAARISSAWGAFYANKETLRCFAVSLKRRLMLLKSVVEPALFWCSGTWKLTTEHNANLRGAQREMIRKMIKCRSVADEHEDVLPPTGPAEHHELNDEAPSSELGP